MAAHLASQPIGHGNQGAGRWAGDLTHGPKATGQGVDDGPEEGWGLDDLAWPMAWRNHWAGGILKT